MPAIQQERLLVVEFTKMSGAGNDFIIIDNRLYHFSNSELARLAKRLCRRREAIGADGLLAFASATSADVDYVMVYYNADGSRGSMCGNGARCLGRFARGRFRSYRKARGHGFVSRERPRAFAQVP